MMSKMVQGSFWQKIIKSRGFRPNGHHEAHRDVKNSQNQPVKCQKGLTGTLFMTGQDRRGGGGGVVDSATPLARPAEKRNFLFFGA